MSLASLPQASQGKGAEAETCRRVSRGTARLGVQGGVKIWAVGTVSPPIGVFWDTPCPAAQCPLERQGTPRERSAPPPTLQKESAVHCSEMPCTFGLLGGTGVQGAPYLEGPGAEHLC